MVFGTVSRAPGTHQRYVPLFPLLCMGYELRTRASDLSVLSLPSKLVHPSQAAISEYGVVCSRLSTVPSRDGDKRRMHGTRSSLDS